MIEVNNENIDVNELMQRVREEVAKRKSSFPIQQNVPTGIKFPEETSNSFIRIQALLNNSELYSQVSSELPQKLNCFPFNIAIIKKAILKVYSFLFKKQRVVNSSLIQALREAIQLNQHLMTELEVFDVRLQKSLMKIDERYLHNDRLIKNDLSQQKRLITMFLEEAKETYIEQPISKEKFEGFLEEEDHLLDAFYVSFEDRFRGGTELIRERLQFYLPILKDNTKLKDLPAVDIGCGRGEWLQILREEGFCGVGIDLNRVMVDLCKQKDLEAYKYDAISYLNSAQSESIGVITGFHIVEHLPFKSLISLLSESLRVLTPGGVVIFETPNSRNILVGTHNFYIDPTHRNPVPSELTQFLLEHIGFTSVKVFNLHPYNDDIKLRENDPVSQRFNDYFYGSQDYAIIGYK